MVALVERIFAAPGGHYTNLVDRQRGLMRDILEYIKECIKPNDPPPPALKDAFDAAKKHIPYPANWPTQDKLRMQELANRNMEQVWNTVLKGSIYGGAAYLGAPLLIRAAQTALGRCGSGSVAAQAVFPCQSDREVKIDL